MIAMLRRRTLPLGLAGALLLAAASGCAEEVDGESSAPSAESSAPATDDAEPTDESEPTDDGPTDDELAEGLLPAEAFGPDADVVTLDVRALAGSTTVLPEGATVTPEECTQGLGKIQPAPDDFGAVAAQTAETPTTVTVQMLVEDDLIEAGSQADFEQLFERCSHIELTLPEGSGSIDLRPFEVPEVGEVNQGVSFTVTIAAPDGSGGTVSALMAVAVEDQRMLFLQQLGPDGTPLDEAAFVELFEQAYEAQQDV